MPEKLKPCPFCGREPFVKDDGEDCAIVSCDWCDVMPRVERDCAKHAIAAWNRRADPRIERAREALTRTARKLNSVAVVERAMNGGGLTTDMEEIVAGVSKALAALDKEVDDAA